MVDPLRHAAVTLSAVALTAACAVGATTASGAAPTGDAAVAPTAAAAPAAPAPPVVLLDPGHNGGNAAHSKEINRQVPDGRGGTKACNTTGTSTAAGYTEHAFNWDVAKRVQARLQKAGVRVVMTRPNDTGVGPCVNERGAAATKAGAALAVSLHADGAAPSGHGFHVIYADPAVRGGERSQKLATTLRDALRGARFAPSDYRGHGGLDGRPDLAGLNTSHVPTALVEAANMRNAAEARLVSSPAGRDRYAAAVAAGVLRYLGR
ncbi:N-acetylmuramoyl-L-alanine amidase [Pseudonocardia phyllosphaerae]|uniref:N-acetylmuramoyl-L-alanine amidase n=1 Tax=Pseudonocardia phyllosphaerae TaxID=3390502 RepID=UPI00397E32A8